MTARRRRPATVASALAVAAALVLAGCDRGGKDPAPANEAAPTTSRTAGSDVPSTPAAVCDPARPAPAREGALAFGGVDRGYVLHVPPTYNGAEAVPLVFDFHGHGSSAAVQLAYSGFAPVADREGFVVVAPEGQGSPRHFSLLGATATDVDDVEFTVALLDHLSTQLCLDPARVYATGMSNGGALSSVLACRAADRFAAVGAVAAMVYLPACEQAPRPVPIVSMMGTADPVVPFAGGRVNCCGNPSIPAAADTMASFARHAGCDAEPEAERIGAGGAVELRRSTGCDEGAAVEFYVIEGGGHTWPGAPYDLSGRGLGSTTGDLDATETLWSFFERHALPSD